MSLTGAWYMPLCNSLAQESRSGSVELIAMGTISGTAGDRSTGSEPLEEGTPANRIGGFSAIEYAGRDNLYWVLADRGPADGAASFPCRVQLIELKIDRKAQAIQPLVVETVMLKDESGKPLVGSLQALPPNRFERGNALDPEGLRVTDAGDFIISDEYGPGIDLFAPDGTRRKSWKLPEAMQLTREKSLESASDGTMPNRGLEGVAISPDGTSITAAMQGPLIQDSRPEGKKRFSDFVRLIQIDLKQNKSTSHFVYPLSHPSSGISEILSYAASEFLVLERDGDKRPAAKYKAIYLTKLDSATDVASLEKIPSRHLPDDIRTARKELFIDLLDERWAIPKLHLMEKPEGLAWGPNLDDGRRLLIVCFDNDFQSDVDSLFLAFAVN